MSRLTGGCHCGANRVVFETDKPLAPRACQCAFCRKHGARTISDPDGSATLSLSPDTIRYRFGSRAADYLICSKCGVYLGAVDELDDGPRVTLNLNAFADPHLEIDAEPVDYEGESPMAKADRRRTRWTPASG